MIKFILDLKPIFLFALAVVAFGIGIFLDSLVSERSIKMDDLRETRLPNAIPIEDHSRPTRYVELQQVNLHAQLAIDWAYWVGYGFNNDTYFPLLSSNPATTDAGNGETSVDMLGVVWMPEAALDEALENWEPEVEVTSGDFGPIFDLDGIEINLPKSEYLDIVATYKDEGFNVPKNLIVMRPYFGKKDAVLDEFSAPFDPRLPKLASVGLVLFGFAKLAMEMMDRRAAAPATPQPVVPNPKNSFGPRFGRESSAVTNTAPEVSAPVQPAKAKSGLFGRAKKSNNPFDRLQ